MGNNLTRGEAIALRILMAACFANGIILGWVANNAWRACP